MRKVKATIDILETSMRTLDEDTCLKLHFNDDNFVIMRLEAYERLEKHYHNSQRRRK